MDMTHKDWSSLQPGGRALPRDMKVAIDYMRGSIGQQICMADIVAATGTPERTLRKHFLMLLWACTAQASSGDCGLPRPGMRCLPPQATASPRSPHGLALRISGVSHATTDAASENCLRRPTAGRCLLDQPGDLGRGEPSRRHTSRPPCLCWSSCPSGRSGIGRATGSPTVSQSCSRRSWRVGQRLAVRLAPATSAAAIPRLGARYCLMGRVVAPGRVRVIVRLIDVGGRPPSLG